VVHKNQENKITIEVKVPSIYQLWYKKNVVVAIPVVHSPIEPASSQRSEEIQVKVTGSERTPLLLLLNLDRLFIKKIVFLHLV
jgi:hypothetical protein